tara:strand:- start:4949 stop:5368 length:420 start_codon:yes stop_codon:yes gene_type:complete
MDKENDIMANLIEKLKEKIGSTKISSQTIHIVLKEAMELVEELNIPGSVKKDNVIKIVKTLVIDLIENEDEEKLILSIIDNNILENTMDLVIKASRGELNLNCRKTQSKIKSCILTTLQIIFSFLKKGKKDNLVSVEKV